MHVKTANRILVIFDLLAVGGLVYLVREHVSILAEIGNETSPVVLDTGMYYLLLLSVFPLIRLVQLAARLTKAARHKKALNLIFIGWFVLCLICANLGPYYVKTRLKAEGYSYCGRKEGTRVSRGGNEVYRLGGCSNSSIILPRLVSLEGSDVYRLGP